MSRTSARVLYWSPRVLGIGFAGFISIFALDVFDESQGFWMTALDLLIHLIPTCVIVAFLVAAWRRAWIGAALFALLGGLYAWQSLPKHVDWVLWISAPLLLIAALFLANWVERGNLRSAL